MKTKIFAGLEPGDGGSEAIGTFGTKKISFCGGAKSFSDRFLAVFLLVAASMYNKVAIFHRPFEQKTNMPTELN